MSTRNWSTSFRPGAGRSSGWEKPIKTKALIALGIAMMVVGIVLVFAGSALAGAILIVLSLILSSVVGAASTGRRVYRSTREWANLARGGGPESIHIVSVQPPQGIFFNHDATVTLEITGEDGFRKQVERDLPVAIPQAAMWKLAGRVPTPIGRLSEERDLNLAIWRKGWQRKRS